MFGNYGLFRMCCGSNIKTILFIFTLIVSISTSSSTLLAAKGYIASASPIRNILISSGLGGLIRDSASSLFEKSGFRFVGDQGTDVRKAVMKSHTIIETRADSSFHERKGQVPDPDLSIEDRTYSERLFGVLNQMNKNTCISKLLCQIGATPLSFGSVGLKINKYVKSVPPVTWNSATFPYIEAFQAGESKGSDVCLQHYSDCTYDLQRMVEFLWIIINPIYSKQLFV
ncbi:hypothetical protein CEXT_625901 [Caerostris extrusa]|uniref:Uncharacterized protein n=1 Tax=Caerostris extrusa TaxID=172846 RepID=A0AAV4XLD2_CAEEX|nr:hypothetical protein CEXT_625901 [Caerostris extrusa]